MSLLEAVGLVKKYGDNYALDSLDLDVPQGSVLGVLGPNGAGKTTAVRALTTLLVPDAGRATIDGIDVFANPHQVRARIGLTGQYAAVDERLTARENLELVGRFFHMGGPAASTRAQELLEQFSLTDASDRVVSGFSGGMRRRLDIAMSLVARPIVLFLDEPTTGLDPRSRNDMWELIKNLTREGMTTLLTTQYLEEADFLADEILVIDHGKAIERGTSRELKERVGGARAVLTFAEPPDVGAVESALGSVLMPTRDIDVTHNVMSLAITPETTVPTVVYTLADASISVVDIEIQRATLDDVFLTLTGQNVAEDNGSAA